MDNYVQNTVFNGLGTQSFTIPIAGPYFVEGHLSLPSLVGGGGASQVVVTINQNGSPIYTGQAGAEGFYKDMLCAANDVIAVVLNSSAAPNLGLNVIKANISIGLGE